MLKSLIRNSKNVLERLTTSLKNVFEKNINNTGDYSFLQEVYARNLSRLKVLMVPLLLITVPALIERLINYKGVPVNYIQKLYFYFDFLSFFLYLLNAIFLYRIKISSPENINRKQIFLINVSLLIIISVPAIDTAFYYTVETVGINYYVFAVVGSAMFFLFERKFLLIFFLFSFTIFSVFLFHFLSEPVNAFKISVYYFIIIIFMIVASFYRYVREKKAYHNQIDLERTNQILLNTNKELKIANNELLKMYKLKDDLIGIISHDLRSPFTAIKGYSDLLFEQEIDGTKKRYLEIISTNAMHQLEYVDEILTLLSSGEANLSPVYEKISVSELVNRSLNSLKILAVEKNISIKKELKTSGIIYLDVSKIYQAINNLLSNAIKYTERDGEIVIRCELTDSFFKLDVIDNGIGFENSENIFKPYSGINTGTLGEKGSGLGLSIAKMYVNAHGGTITAKKRKTGGSIFSFSIPINNKYANPGNLQ